MKRFLTLIFLILSSLLVRTTAQAQVTNGVNGKAFMNLPETVCAGNFASMNAFIWGSGYTNTKVTWTITNSSGGSGGYTILYGSDGNNLVNQAPDNYKMNALTLQFNLKNVTYTISANITYKDSKGNTSTQTITKQIFSKDCSMAQCYRSDPKLGASDFKEDFGTFPINAGPKAYSDPTDPTAKVYYTPNMNIYTSTSGGNFDDNSYCIYWNTQVRSEWMRVMDHTQNGVAGVSNGGMLVANSAYEKIVFFEKTVKVCPGSRYNFSAWFLNTNTRQVFNSTCNQGNSDGYHYAGVTFQIVSAKNPTQILSEFKTYDVSMNLDPNGRQWLQYGGTFKITTDDNAVILRIRNDNPGGCGNDIAIDDIQFNYCPPDIQGYVDGLIEDRVTESVQCAGAPLDLTANGDAIAAYFQNPVYRWEFSYDQLNWSPLADSTGLNPTTGKIEVIRSGSNGPVLHFSPGALTGNPLQPIIRYYRLRVYEYRTDGKYDGDCGTPSSAITITILPKPIVKLSSSQVCQGTAVNLTVAGQYTEYVWQEPAEIAGRKDEAVIVTPMKDTKYLAWGIARYGNGRECYDTGSAWIKVDTPAIVKVTGGPLEICAGSTPVNFQISPDNNQYKIKWSSTWPATTIPVNSPAGDTTYASTTNQLNNIYPWHVGLNYFKATVTKGTCVTADSLPLMVYSQPVAKTNSSKMQQCNQAQFTMKATAPTSDQVGQWTFIRGVSNGTSTITNPSSPTTTVNITPAGTTDTLIWTVTNKGKSDCKSTDMIILFNSKPLTTSVNLTSTVVCANSGAIVDLQLNGTVPVNPGETGKWTSSVPAMVTFDDDTKYNTTAHIVGQTTTTNITLYWTITNGICTPGSTGSMTVRVKAPPTITITNTPVKACNNVPSVDLMITNSSSTISQYEIKTTGPNAMPGFAYVTGAWNTSWAKLPLAIPANTAPGIYNFILSVWENDGTGSPYAGCRKDVTFTVELSKPSTPPTGLTVSTASICDKGDVQLTINGGVLGTDPSGNANAVWKWYKGGCGTANGGVLVTPDVANADNSVVTFKNVTATTTYYVVAESTGSCGNSTCASTTITVYKSPVAATAGTDQKVCNQTTQFTLNGNTPSPTGATGTWTVLYGNATVITPTDPKSKVTVPVGDSSVLQWEISNGNCATTKATVTIVNYAIPVQADAGTDQKVCAQATPFTLNANTPSPSTAIGRWTVVYGAANFGTSSINDPKAKVTVAIGDSVVLRWTISNGNCATTSADVRIVNYANPILANAGTNQKACAQATPFVLSGNTPSPSTAIGRWTVTYGAATFNTSINNPNAQVNVAVGDSVVFRWTITNGNCAETYSEMSIVNYAQAVTANAGTDQKVCAQNTPFTLNGNTPTPATAIGRWTVVYGTANFGTSSINDPKANVSVAIGDSVVLRWTITNGNCATTSSDVRIVNYADAIKANAGTNLKACAQNTPFTMSANAASPSTAIGRWTVTYGSATFSPSINDPNAKVTVAIGDSVVLRWTITNGVCADSYSEISVVNFAQAVTANAGIDQKACAQNTAFTLNGNTATPATAIGRWTVVYGAANFGASSINDPKAKVTVAVGDSVVLRWTITNGVCADSYDEMSIVNFADAVKANAGLDQKVCAQATAFTLDGNVATPSTAIGRWTVVYGAANFGASSINDPKAKINVAIGDSVVLRWTITNGVCADSYDEVSIVNYANVVKANAGIDQKACAQTTAFTLDGNTATPATAIGRWTVVYGNANFGTSSINDPKAKVTVAVGDSVVLRWTITNGVCADSYDEMSIVNFADAVKANAGIDQKACAQTTAFTLDGNTATPATAIGRWTVVYGTPNFGTSSINDPKAKITVAVGDSVVLRWTITNGVCADSYDEVSIVNYADAVKANAGIDQKACAQTTAFTLDGNTATPATAIGRWTVVYGAANFGTSSINDPKAKINVAIGDSVVLRWTITNGVCADSYDEMSIVNFADAVKANAGIDQKACAQTTAFTLDGNTATPATAIGRWTVVYGNANFGASSINDPKAKVTVAVGDSVVLRWTITNGVCADSYDEMSIVNFADAVKANAGIDQKACAQTTPFTLDGNTATPATAIGRWTVVYGAANFSTSSINDPKAKINVAIGDSIVLRWTITNGVCADSYDEVSIVNYADAVKANAGIDQKACAQTTAFTLDGNTATPATAIGRWTVVYGAANFGTSSINDPKAKVTVAIGDSVVLRWTITNGVCADSYDEMSIVNFAEAVKANAGIDQKVCAQATPFTLDGNTATPATAIGRWTVVYGAANFGASSINDPKAKINVAIGDSVVLRWTITNGVCADSYDEVSIVNYAEAVKANAGIDQKACAQTTPFTLDGNTATPATAIGRWTVVYGAANFGTSSINDPKAQVTVAVGDSVVLRWTIVNGNCADSYDEMSIVNFADAVKANAGIDQKACAQATPFTLDGNTATPATAIGRWTVVYGAANFGTSSINDPKAKVTVAVGDSVVLRWTITNGVCADSYDEISIVNFAEAVKANAGIDQKACAQATPFTLDGNTATPATAIGRWTVVYGNANFGTSSINDPKAQVTVAVGDSVVLRWTITNGVCADSYDEMSIVNFADAVKANAGIDQKACAQTTAFTLDGNTATPTTAIGRWTVVYGAANFGTSSINDPKAQVTVAVGDSVVLRWTITNGVCADSYDEMSIVNFADAVKANAGIDQKVCAQTTPFTLDGNTATPATAIGRWTVVYGAANFGTSSINDPKAKINVAIGDSVVLRWTITNGVCADSYDEVSIVNYAEAVKANAGIDQKACAQTTPFTLDGNTATPATAIGRWTVVYGAANFGTSSINDPKAQVTVAVGDSVVLRWTIVNGNCADSYDEMSIVNFAEAVKANAGIDQKACAQATPFTLDGNTATPATAIGRWTVVYGAANFGTSSINDPKAQVTVAVGDSVVLRWTIVNGNCADSYDEMSIVNFAEAVKANAGIDQKACAQTTPFTLDGNTATPATAIGRWTVVYGAANFGTSSINDPKAKVTVAVGDSVVLRWTIVNGNCADTYDEMSIVNFAEAVKANAGIDQKACAQATPFTLDGNTATPATAIGRWTVVYGAANFGTSSINDPKAQVTVAVGDSVVLRWTITNGVCADTYDEMSIVNFADAVKANAGIDQKACAQATPFTLDGNTATPATAIGRWTVVYGAANFGTSSINDPKAQVTVAVGDSVVLRWTITNGVCADTYDEMSIVNFAEAVKANAGIDQKACAQTTPFTLDGNTATPATAIGRWTVVYGAANFGTSSINDPKAQVTVAVGDSVVLRWTIVNGNCADTYDEMSIVNFAEAVKANAGIDQKACAQATPFTLDGNTATPATAIGRWTVVYGAANFGTSSINDPKAQVTVAVGDSVVLRWTIVNGNCADTYDEMSIVNFADAVKANAGADQKACAQTTPFTLDGNTATPATAIGRWTVVYGAANFGTSSINDPKAQVTVAVGDSVVLRWTITNGVCADSYDEMSIVNFADAVKANAGIDQKACAQTTPFTLDGNTATPATAIGRWTVVYGAANFGTSSINDPKAQVTVAVGDSVVFRWTIVNGNCADTYDEMSIVNYAEAVKANAGIDQKACAQTTAFTLDGNTATPATAIGRWTVVYGAANFGTSSINDPKAQVTVAVGDSVVLRWTITNGVCADSYDEMSIVNFAEAVKANAGADQKACAQTTAFTLDGNTATPATAIGRWTVVYGAANFGTSSINDPKAQVTVAVGDSVVLRWTITNGVCADSYDEMSIVNFAEAVKANAGADQKACAQTTAFTLDGNTATPATAIGRWTVVYGAANFGTSSINDPKAQVTVPVGDSVVLRWTIVNGNCADTYDEMSIVNFAEAVKANAGIDQKACAQTTPFTLDGNTATPATAIGRWTVVYGAANFGTSSINDPKAQVTVAVGDSVVLRWTIVNGNCADTYDEMSIVNFAEAVKANAGIDQKACAQATPFTLDGNTATPATAIGRWTVVYGAANFGTSSINDPKAQVTVAVGDSVVLRWTIVNGNCADTYDEMSIVNFADAVKANAGIDQKACAQATPFTLDGNTATPATAIGRWTVVYGAANFGTSSINDPKAQVTVPVGDSVVLRWTITNGVCADTYDEMSIVNYAEAVKANAGIDQKACAQTTPFTLDGNTATPATAIGRWTVVYGAANFGTSSINDPKAQVTVAVGDSVVLRWTITNGVCADSYDEMSIVNFAEAVKANAGADQKACAQTTAFTLDGNTATPATAIGRWTVVYGAANFGTSSINDPKAQVTVAVGDSVVLRWTITNGVCADTYDEMSIVNFAEAVKANAGIDQKACAQTTPFTLDGNTATPATAIGRWTVVYGAANFGTSSINDPKAQVTVAVGDSVVLRWTVTNGVCADTYDEMSIVNFADAVKANAGIDQKACAQTTPFTLDGNTASPATAIGRWTVVYGAANFGTSSINDPKAQVTVAVGDSVVLRWTIVNGNCADTYDEMSIVNFAEAVKANAGIDQKACAQATPFTLDGNTATPATAIGRWTVVYGTANFGTSSINDPKAQVTVAVGDSVVLRWTIVNGNCADTYDEMSIVNFADAVKANAGIDQKACAQATPFTLDGNTATPATAIGRWTVVYGAANFGTSSINDPKAQVTVAVGDSVVLRWTIVNGNCADSYDEMSIVNFAEAVKANAGIDQKACAQATPFTLDGNTATPATAIGRWTVVYGAANFGTSSINDPKAQVTVAVGDSVVLRWTITNGVCADTYDEMSIVNFADAVKANAGIDQKACAQTTPFTLDGNTATPATAIGRWTVVYGAANFGTSSINDPKAQVTVAVGDSVVLRWTITNGVCADSYDEMSIVNFAEAVKANAGADQKACAQTTAFTLDGNTATPATAIGRWTVVYGAANFGTSSINDPKAQVTVAVGDSVVLRWTIVNGNCADTYDEMSIVNYAEAVKANAGINQKACAQTTAFTLDGNTATPATAIGRWTVVYGAANFGTSSINDPKAQVTVAVGDSVVLRWTIVNGNCADTYDEMSIVNFAEAVKANAGADQKACAQATPFTLDGNTATPATAIGRWTVVYGAANFGTSSINDPKAQVTVAVGDSVVLRWTIVNGNCADTYDEMSIVNFAEAVKANAGADQKACAQATPFTLDGNTATPATAIGRWTVVYGAANFGTSSINDPKAQVTVAVGDSVVLRWTIVNGNCADTYDEMSIVNFADAVKANAGIDQKACAQTTPFTVDGNTATPATAIGRWTVVYGAANFGTSSINDPKAQVTVAVGDSVVLRWTIVNGNCADSYDEMSIVNYAEAVKANAGIDQKACAQTTPFTLDGNTATPATAIGRWTVVYGAANFGTSSINDPKAQVTVAVGDSVVLRWTITNGVCADTYDEMSIVNFADAVKANAGIDQKACAQTTPFTLDGNTATPATAIGRWTVVYGNANFGTSSINDPKAQVTVAVGDSVVLRWTITNGVCADSYDEMSIVNFADAVKANAGIDQKACAQATPFTLDGNTATPATAIGRWTVVYGAANFGTSSINDPKAQVTVAVGDSVVLRWTITNGVCADTYDEMSIVNYADAVKANAGADQKACAQTTPFTLDGNTASPATAIGRWTVVYGTANFGTSSINDPKAQVTVAVGDSVVLRWTIVNGNCADSYDEMSIVNFAEAVKANAGIDQKACAQTTAFTLNGNTATPATAIGRWTVVYGAANFGTSSINDPKAQVTVAVGDSVVLRWTIVNGNCADSYDEMSIVNFAEAVKANAGADQKACAQATPFTLDGNTATPATAIGRWTVVYGAANFGTSSINDPKAQVTVAVGDSVVLRWTIVNGNCADTYDEMSIVNFAEAVKANAGIDQKACAQTTPFTLDGNTATPATAIGRWTVVYGAANFGTSSINDPKAQVTVAVGDSVVLRWTIVNGNCADTYDEMSIVNFADAVKANAGIDQKACAQTTPFTLDGNTATPATAIGRWTVVYGAANFGTSSINDPKAQVTVAVGDSVVLRWTITNGVCADTYDEMSIVNFADAVKANAGIDQKACAQATPFTLDGNTATPATAIGRWTVVYGNANFGTSSINDPKAQVTVAVGDSVVLRWTITNGVCADSYDEMSIVNFAEAVKANAGIDQKACAQATPFTLDGNTATPATAIGRWTVVYGAANFGTSSINDPKAQVTVAVGDSVVLRWTITNGVCADTYDEMSIVNYADAVKANAGADQKACAQTTPFTLNGNTASPATAIGRWTVVYGTANFGTSSINDPKAQVTVAVGDSVVLRWTIVNGVCADSYDDVILVNYKTAPTAIAGGLQEKCNSTDDFIMAANDPGPDPALGTWTIVSGNATIHNNHLYNTAVTVLPGNNAVLQWTITNGNCTATSSQVTLINYAMADKANAGPDQAACNQTNDFTLDAAQPSVSTASGIWTVIKGNATIRDKNKYNSGVYVAPGDTATLRWTISNGNCTSTDDEIIIINYKKPVDAKAGPNQEHCNDATFQMNASDPGVAGAIGTWIVTGGDKTKVTISNENDKNATITVQAGETVQLTWVVSNGVCEATSSSLTLINRKPILGNTISADQTLCKTETAAALTGASLSGGNGSYSYQWQSSTTGATGPFTNINGATNDSYQPGVLAQNTWYRRLVTSGACIDDISNVVSIVVMTQPPFVVTTPPSFTTECVLNKDYTQMFGTPQFSHAPYTNEQLTVTSSDVTNVIDACTKTITRTWVAVDRCGTSVKTSQTITIVDTKAPVFTTPAPANITVDCDKVPALVNLLAKDDCGGDITIVPVETRKNIPGNCANNYQLIRTWTAKDACNTGATLTQIITVQDTTAPVFTMPTPANITVDCDKIPAGPALTAADNCTAGVINVQPKDSVVHKAGDCDSKYTIFRKWTALDQCGNGRTVVQIITVQDTTRPVFSMPAPKDTIVDCDKLPGWPVISASDNCTGSVQVNTASRIVKLPGACSGSFMEIRTWSATDNCGNTATMQQIVTVQDTTKPVFTILPPADITVNCDAIPAPAANVTATDNCSSGSALKLIRTITTENIPGACGNSYRIIRTWTAVDACTNQTTVRQVITVVDTTRPVISPAPADVEIYCQDKVPASPQLIASDNCDPAFPKKVTYTEDPYVKDICNGYTIVRRWSVTDACGNKANDVIQRIVIKPCAKPQLETSLPVNCSNNPKFALKIVGTVSKPTYTLVAINPANAVNGLPITQTSNIFNLNGATSASFIVTDGTTGCSSDTVKYDLKYLQTPVVKLGKDTTICGGNSLVLDAGAANFAYSIHWSTGETTQRINVTKAGTYWVNVSNGQCATTDTIKVGLIPTPLVTIPDTTICRGQSVKLDAYVNGASYLWSTGATTSSILVGTQEDFWVKVSKSGCITIDTVKVRVNPPPDISLNRDTTICPDQSIMLTVNSNGGRIQWQTGETSNSIVVNKPGGYWVAVSRDNCVVRDTVNVRLKPSIKVNLGPDRNICPGTTITLDGTTDNAISYLWNDGDPNPVKQINQAGRYKLAVMDKFCQRVYMDSVKVNVTGIPKVNLGNDTVMCKGETLTLKAIGTGISAVRWDNGSSAPTMNVTESGTYTVTVFNDCGSATDKIRVDFTVCEPKPQVPNAFSPNGDGRNDVFKPVVRGPMYEYELRIFNRWGEMIFISDDQHRGWDGKHKGVPVDVGTYVWWLTYKKSANGTATVLKGEVTVIR